MAPSGNPPTIGWSQELHGPGGHRVYGYPLTRHELLRLASIHAAQVADAEWEMRDGSYCPRLFRLEQFAHERLRVIAGLVGEEPVRVALAEARALVFARATGGRLGAADLPDHRHHGTI